MDRFRLCGSFDIAARLLKSYDADTDVLKRYAALFNSYKMARDGK